MSPRASRTLLPILVVASLLIQSAVLAQPTGTVGDTLPTDPWTPEGLAGFLENGGQVDPSVALYAWTPRGGVALVHGGAIVTLVDGDLGANVHITFRDASQVRPEGREPLPGVTNMILGNDPAGWTSGLVTYSQGLFRDAWDGIDLVYKVTDGGLKYEMVVRPGADPTDIALDVSGHTGMTVDARGDLVIDTVAGVVTDRGLVAFYADDPSDTVGCAFQLLGDDGYGFRLDDFDPSRTLVIDPLVYSTFVGGGAGELEEPVAGVAVDAAGRALVAGQTNTTDFPVTTGAFQTSNAGGGTDLFVLRMAADGSDVEWSTYLGGTGADFPYDMALDGGGLPVVVGRTNSTDFPTSAGSIDPDHTGSDHQGFLLKLDGNGAGLAYSTYLGGNMTDEITSLVLDDADNVYLAGNTLSKDLPTTTGAAFPNHTGFSFDAFVAKVRSDGSAIIDLTYLGGTKWDVALTIDVDGSGAVYVGGETISTDFPATNGSFQDFLMNNLTRDGFIAKLVPGMGSVGWATYIGGLASDYVEFLSVDANGSVYAAGDTESGDFPVTNGSYQVVHQGATETFILRMAANGSQLEYCTFLGGSDREYCEGLIVDDQGRALVVGSTISLDFPTITGVQQEIKAGQFDTFLFRLAYDGVTPLYSTFLGGTTWDLANGVAMDDDGMAVMVGATDSTNFPTTSGAFQETHGGRVDVFVTKIDMFLDTQRPTAVPGTDMIVDQHTTVDFDGSASTDNVGVVNWTWEFTYNGTDLVFYGPTFSWTFDLAGKNYIYLTVRDAAELTDRQWVSVFVNDTELPVAIAPDHIQAQQHWTVTLDGGASHDNVGVAVYRWTFHYGGEDQTLLGEKVDFTFDDAGLFDILMTVEDANGNADSDSLTVTVIDITSPDLVIEETDVAVDQHARVVFDASASTDNVHITNISWQFVYAGSPVVLYGFAPSFTFDRAGSYTVAVTAEDANGNRAFDEVGVTVRDTTPPVAVAGSDVTIDQGDVVDLDSVGSSDNVGIVNWEWIVVIGEEVSTFSGQQNAFTFTAAGQFTVTLNVIDAAGNVATDSFAVHVRDVTPPVAVVGENMVVGQGDSVTFDGTASTDNMGIVTYNWEMSRGNVKEPFHTPTFDYEFTIVGIYRLVLQVFDGSGLSDTDELQIAVLDTEAPTADAGPDQEIELDGQVRFNGDNSTDNVNIVSWVWTFNYNQAQEELQGTHPSFTFELQGTYIVTLTVTDDAGNSHTDTLSVKVTSDEQVGGPGGTVESNPLLLTIVLLLVVVSVVIVLVLRRVRRPKPEEGDMGWAPTEEEKKSRDTKRDEGDEDGAATDGDGPPGVD
jgi:PKD repeat protein